MGTRGLTIVHHEGKYKLSQYGQWDHYPGGQGLTILDFLRDKLRGSFVTQKLPLLYEPDEATIKQWYADAGAAPDSQWVSMDIADKFKAAHPTMDRDMGGKILEYIQNADGPVPVRIDVDFAADSLFCEFAYVVDFDSNKFEVFKGFNTEQPLTEADRFYHLPLREAAKSSGEQYYPVRLLASFDIDNLPTKEEFLVICAPPEPEDEEVQPVFGDPSTTA